MADHFAGFDRGPGGGLMAAKKYQSEDQRKNGSRNGQVMGKLLGSEVMVKANRDPIFGGKPGNWVIVRYERVRVMGG